MEEYHKIDSVFKRDEKGKFIEGQFSRPEFEYLADVPWLWTEKIDGTNIRIMWLPDGLTGHIKIGGKTDSAQLPNKLVNSLNQLIPVWYEGITNENHDASTVFTFDAPVTLYGEGYGAGIQSGGNYSQEQKFILFDVKIGNWWLKRENVEDIGKKLGLDVVPTIFGWYPTLNNMIAYVSDHPEEPPTTDLIGSKAKKEGFVGTPLVPLFNRKGERIITKVKFKDFR